MKTILTMLAAAMLGATVANAGPAAEELSVMAGPGQTAAAAPPPAPKKPAADVPEKKKINLFPSMADIHRWYQDGTLGPAPAPYMVPPPPARPAGGPLIKAPRAYRITVASAGGQVNVEIARSTAAPGETPLIEFSGGKTGNMFSGTVLLGDTVQMAGYVNINSGLQIKHSEHFTVMKIPFGTGAKFMIITGNGIAFKADASEIMLDNTAEVGFRMDVPIGTKTTLLRFSLTGGPGVAYTSRSQEAVLSGTVMGNLSIIRW
ncbi:MAG TPA: hypothetical protein PKI19_10540 [Elusimicrobiales bacterium]|nr:hypothetical protein [Elusimicrobiales bacterium]